MTFDNLFSNITIRDIMYGPVREWMQEVTGIPLTNVVDLTASAYEYTGINNM